MTRYETREEAVDEYASAFKTMLDFHFANSVGFLGGFERFRSIVTSFKGCDIRTKSSLYSLPITKILPSVRIEGKVTTIARDMTRKLSPYYRLVGRKDVRNWKTGGEYHRPSLWIPLKPTLDLLEKDWKELSSKKPTKEFFSDLELKMIFRMMKHNREAKAERLQKRIPQNDYSFEDLKVESAEGNFVYTYKASNSYNCREGFITNKLIDNRRM